MVGRRLFIGNLPRETLRADLESVLTSTLNGSTFHSVEIRQKNDATFAFVDVDSQQIEKCVSDLNQATVKGQVLKVQMAKENFMERLKKEREGLPVPRHVNEFNAFRPRIPNQPMGRPEGRKNYAKESGDYDFEIVSLSKNDQKNSNSTKSQKEIKKTLPLKNTDSDSSDEEEERGGVPMFRGLGFYPGLLQPRTEAPVAPKPVPKIIPPPPPVIIDRIGQKMLAIAANKPIPRDAEPDTGGGKSEPPTQPTTLFAGGLKLNPRKKERSDQLRVESLEWRQQFQQSRSNLIRNALSNTNTGLAEPISKKPKTDDNSEPKSDFLFGNENDDEDYSIKVKPQYEGKAGQKMLELNANFAWDKRFQIDERFADEEEKKIPDSSESEKNSQLDILGQILGKTMEKTTQKPVQDVWKPIVRFDPTREDHRRLYEVNYARDKDKDKVTETKTKIETEKIQKPKSTTSDPPEKSTFKVAPNLKNLFNDTGFSLLSTFGGNAEKKKANENETVTDGDGEGQGQPRSFWNKNPFKYDSSDDEDDEKEKSKKKVDKPRNYFKEDLFKRDSFFFRENDERLANVFEEFLGGEEDLEQVRKKFNDLGRSELKLIARSKWKNSKRKNEKRVKIMRLVRRKKRREAKNKEKARNAPKV